jgi:hypothetical protein
MLGHSPGIRAKAHPGTYADDCTPIITLGELMPIAIYFNPPAMTAAAYDEGVRRIAAAGQGNPAGRLYHCAFGADDKLQVFDVWESQEQFEKFGETLLPIAAELGLDLGQPVIEPIHDIIVPG